MDINYVKNALEGLNSSSSKRIQDSLLHIKSNIIVNDKGIKIFRDCDGLNYLLPHLRKPNERILDLTLSILGNLCLEEKSNILIGQLNSYGSLVTILNTVCRDSILGRTSRVIGNLAQNQSNAENLHSHGAVKALVDLIENRDKTTSYATLSMAVRAIRQLWMVKDKRNEMLSLNAVRCISALLSTECEKKGIIKSVHREKEEPKKSQEELINAILKCMGHFTTYSVVDCAEQIKGNGKGYHSLVALIKTHEPIALKCLFNLCYITKSRLLLGQAGLIECLVDLLQKRSDVSCWPEGATKALSQLSRESVNRLHLRNCGGLSLLVAAARDDSYALHALLQYVFDDESFQMLIRTGLVGLLTDKLKDYITTMEYDHNIEIVKSGSSSVPIKRKDITENEPGSVYDIVLQNLTENNVGSGLFTRRKSILLSETTDDLKVVIERDSLFVGFVDAIDSDASAPSESEDNEPPSPSPPSPPRRKGVKRARSKSPNLIQKKSHIIKMAHKDWTAGVYWEPMSSDWPSPCRSSTETCTTQDKGPTSPASDMNFSDFSPEHKGSSSRRNRWDLSPDSGTSAGEGGSTSPNRSDYQWSPNSSGPSSPYSTNDESSDSEISGRYSPVCSDTNSDSDDEEKKISAKADSDLKAAQVAHDLDDLVMDDQSDHEDSPSDDVSKIDINSKTSIIACVMVLLFRVAQGSCRTCSTVRDEAVHNRTMISLTGRECLNGLLDYVERCDRPIGRAARILARVLSNHLCLISILRHRVVLRLHYMTLNSKHPPNLCAQCKQIIRLSSRLLSQLSVLAESSYGIGKICYHLLKGSSSMKQTLSLTLPYIVRTEKVLKKFLIDCNGLNFLLKTIADSKEDIQVCVTALVKLANNIHIKDPKLLENRFKSKIQVKYNPNLDNLPPEDVVIFQLDDATTVRANKLFLCQHSDVFSAMLMGQFRESGEKFVRLKNVSKSALEYLITLLQCGLNNPKCDIEEFPLAENLEINLEVLLLTDRFLFEKLKQLLSSAIVQFKLAPDTADIIYIWSLSEGMGFLCVEAVAYLLTGQMAEEDRLKSFKNILNLQFKDQWLEDIKSMIVRQLVK
ncbi:armadillo repeat-containing protein 5 isoform X1 [Vanessa tameamea]|uniref:Armadillo repeat-containing protein 5 isoform X1 n=2 Tax=Vanessa tameamea TaxID=334116 RepID=A0A8B8IRE2_VANTA|nr:armadillo repeat-containing protein 5 isoform X1 [Vanessa tameamea]